MTECRTIKSTSSSQLHPDRAASPFPDITRPARAEFWIQRCTFVRYEHGKVPLFQIFTLGELFTHFRTDALQAPAAPPD